MTQDIILDNDVVDEELVVDGNMLFQVWIDVFCGQMAIPDWEANSQPQPLKSALKEAIEARSHGFPAIILPEGKSPRPDGLFPD